MRASERQAVGTLPSPSSTQPPRTMGTDGLIALPDSLVRLVCRDLSVRDVASLLLTTKELAFLASDVHERGFYRC